MKRLYFIVAALFIPFAISNTASAQSVVPDPRIEDVVEDIRGRVEGVVEWNITKDLALESGFEARFMDDMRSMDRINTFIGATYDIGKYVKVGGEYIHINLYDTETSAWNDRRHRVNLNVEGNIEFGDVELSLRERVQTTFRTDSVNRYEKCDPEAILRSRLMAVYKIPGTSWSPYILFELHNTLNAPKPVANFKTEKFETENYVTRYRGGIGAKYRINRNNRLDFYYYIDFDRSYNIDYKGNSGNIRSLVMERELRHIFGVSYKFKL